MPSLCSHSVPCLGEGLSILLPQLPIWYPFQVVIRSVHGVSRILLTCLAQVHFRLLTSSITSATFVLSVTQVFVFLPRDVVFNILLSIIVCVAATLFFNWLVSTNVSATYVIVGSICLSKHVPMLPLKMSQER